MLSPDEPHDDEFDVLIPDWSAVPDSWSRIKITDIDVARDIHKHKSNSHLAKTLEQKNRAAVASTAWWNVTLDIRHKVEDEERNSRTDQAVSRMAEIETELSELMKKPAPLSKEDMRLHSDLNEERAELAAQARSQVVSEGDRLANADHAIASATSENTRPLTDALRDLCYVRRNRADEWLSMRERIKKITPIGAFEKAMDGWDKAHRSGARAAEGFDGFGFKPMGLDGGSYYFMIDASKQIVKLSAAALTQTSGLLQLASKSRWLSSFGCEGKISIVDAADALMRACEKCGLFDPSMVRGRGIWFDAGRVVAHLGDRLLVDGIELPLSIESKYMYVRRPALDVNLSAPMTQEDGRKFLALVSMGAWVGGGLAARYMAGQIVCAAICGALGWRPHSWLTGRAQSGKSTMSAIIKAALGNMLIHVLKTTTAPAIRQILKGDALTVLYDEADTEDDNLRRIVQGVIDLARIASGDDGGVVAKGTTHGDAIAWTVRSCFVMASVNSSLIQESDKSRFEVSELDMDRHAKQTSTEFATAQAALLTDGFGARFCARAIKMVPTVRANAKTFSAALVPILTKQRSSDMHGAMLAGAFSLESDEVLTLDRAKTLVTEYGIAKPEHKDIESDEVACWKYILQCRIAVINNENRQEMIPIGVLLDIAIKDGMTDEEYEKAIAGSDLTNTSDFQNQSLLISTDTAHRSLQFSGFSIKADGDGKQYVAVMNNSKEITDMLKARPNWAADYEKVLKRLKGAKPSPGPIGFGSRDRKSRATMIPYEDD